MSDDQARECGDCMACCQGWLKIEVYGESVHPGKGCQHCANPGCGIYQERPKVCQNFKCLWLSNKKAMPDWMRPDRSKVITYLYNLLGENQPFLITAIPVGKIIPTRSLNKLKEISVATKYPLIYVKRFKDKQGNYTNQKEFNGYGSNDIANVMHKIQGLLEKI